MTMKWQFITPEEWQQRKRDRAVANNDDWQLRNIERYLRPYVDACQAFDGTNAMVALKLWSEFCDAESKRLGERADLMERSGIERLPNVHRDLTRELLKQAEHYCHANAEWERKQGRTGRVLTPESWQAEVAAGDTYFGGEGAYQRAIDDYYNTTNMKEHVAKGERIRAFRDAYYRGEQPEQKPVQASLWEVPPV